MASNRFPLAAVLRFRERIKEEKEFELRGLHLEQARMEEEIRALEAQLEGVGAVAATHEEQIFLPAELKLQDEYAQLLDRKIESKRAALVSFREKVLQKRQELTEAARDVKSLELLRQRLDEKRRRQQDAEEQKFIDEIGQRKFLRRTSRQ
jgi:flagellar export protein FliJ